MKDIEKRIEEKFHFTEDGDVKFPNKNLLIEVTNRCNNRCIFCANRKMTRKQRNIDKDFAKRILRDCYANGVREVGFYATGEPLLYPYLSELISYARQLGYQYIYLTTNGLLAQRDVIEKLLLSGLNSIKFSINAINKGEYFFIHGIDAFDVVMKNLKDCFSLKQSYNFKLWVSYIATKYTTHDQRTIEQLFSRFCDKVIIQYAKNQGGYLPSVQHNLSCPNVDKTHFEYPCPYVFDSLTVTCEGYLTCCCMDFQNYLAYANLNNESIDIAWNNSTINKFRTKHKNKQAFCSLCDSCINSRHEEIKPLSKQLATIVKKDFFEEDKELEERISKFLEGKQ